MILSSLHFCLIKGVIGYSSADSPRTATELTAIWLKEMSETSWKALADRDEGGKGLKGYIPPNLCRDLELGTPTRHSSDPPLPLCPPCSLLSFIWRCRVLNHLMPSCDVGEWQLNFHACNVCVRGRRDGVCQFWHNVPHDWHVQNESLRKYRGVWPL